MALVCLNIRSNAYGLPVVNMACLKAEGNCRMLKYAAGWQHNRLYGQCTIPMTTLTDDDDTMMSVANKTAVLHLCIYRYSAESWLTVEWLFVGDCCCESQFGKPHSGVTHQFIGSSNGSSTCRSPCTRYAQVYTGVVSIHITLWGACITA